MVHLGAYAQDLGYSEAQGVTLVSLIGLGSLLGRFTVGRFRGRRFQGQGPPFQWSAQQGVGLGISNGAKRPPAAGTRVSTSSPPRRSGRTWPRVTTSVASSAGEPPSTVTRSIAEPASNSATVTVPASARAPG